MAYSRQFNGYNQGGNSNYPRNNYGSNNNYTPQQQQVPTPEEFIDDRIAVHQLFMNRIKEQGLDPSEFAFAIGGWVTSYCLEKKGKRI